MQEPRKHLINLGLSDSEVTVYLAMLAGARAARDLQKTTRLKRPTIYYALGCLEKRGLISRTCREGDKRFSVEPLERLNVLANVKVLDAMKLKDDIGSVIPTLKSDVAPIDQKPTVAFFEGVDAVKNVIMDILYCKNDTINSVAPKENFFWQVGEGFVKSFVEERIRRGITTKNLWDAPVDQKTLRRYYSDLSEIRLVPEVMRGKFSTTVFLYDDKTIYISSIKNSYCVVLTSQEHHYTMQAWFDGLWQASKPLKIKD